MIKSKKDYLHYLEQDRIARGMDNGWKSWFRQLIAPNYTWRFQKKLRKLEYYKNCRQDIFGRMYYLFLRLSFRRTSLKLGFSIPPNVFGPGLAIPHYGTIIVNNAAKVGPNCRIQACTNIGSSGGNKEAPIIGENVYIGPGAKIYGNITIGNNIAIAANSSVNRSFEEDNILIGGSPAKRIKEIDIKRIIKHIN